jgi:hypothetical protein
MTAQTRSAIPQISPAAYEEADQIRERFVNAKPFRHVVIEDFFDPAFAERLLEEFPTFDKRLAKSESGEIGGKAVNTKIATIGPAYEDLYRLLSSAPFLEYASRLSGIEGLILDPAMYGGGTHENLHGQDLDPHVDFNYDQSSQLHRRLNLIVYLNKGWRSEWGGAIEIHSNPRKPQENQIQGWDPIFNRAIMFETNEYSWHGFPKIELPEDKRSLSRKSISIYLYTRDRPAEEIAPLHATFYVQRPLPGFAIPGYTLRAEDVTDLTNLLARRDKWIEMYQKAELDNSRNRTVLHSYISHLETSARVPSVGYIKQEGAAAGFYPDLWTTPEFKVRLSPLAPVAGLTLKGLRPEGWPPAKVIMSVNGQEVGRGEAVSGSFVIEGRFSAPQAGAFDLGIRVEAPPREKPAGGDVRDLALMLIELRARHPRTALLKRVKG